MKKFYIKIDYRYHMPVLIGMFCIILLFFLPTGYEGAIIYKGTDRCKAEIVEVDNGSIKDIGMVKSGEQNCKVKLLGGKFEGQIVDAYNMLNGTLEADKIYEVGDRALVVIHFQEDEIRSVNMIDHYRLDKQLILGIIFVILLIVFAGRTGVRAIISFVVTILTIWKVLIPGYLNGLNPIFMGLGITLLLTILIISLVYGFDRRALSAISGSALGIITTLVLGILFTDLFKIHGAIMSYSESLLYSGYSHLNLTQIFMSSIFIGSSGAVMDLAVDITSSVCEVIDKKPDISWKEATMSGLRVGKAAMGTMTTTLLLAYSGGYIALLMVFMAQGTPIYNILNYKYVSAEILETMVGSIGLVTVAPFTAITSGFLLTLRKKQEV